MNFKAKKTSKLWTKYYILIMIYSLLTSTANYMLMTAIPLYAIKLGGNKSIAGLMMGVFMIAAILFRPVFGKLLDDKSRRIVLIIGATISMFIYFSYLFAFSVGILLLFRAFNGIGFSATTNASGTVVSDVIPHDRLSEGVGYFGMSNTIATAFGPALSLFIIKYFDYNVLFFVALAIGIISFVVTFFIDYEKKKMEDRNPLKFKDNKIVKAVVAKKNITDIIFEKTALPTALVIVFLAVTIGGIMTFIPIYAATRGIENISIYFTVYALSLLFTRFFAGKLADYYGVSTVIIPGIITVIVSFVILAFATSLPVFLLSAVLYGIGYGSAQPTLNAVMIKLCPKERRGVGNSTFFTAMDIGSGGGAVIWGVISQNLGFTWVYLACAASVAISLMTYIFILQKQLNNGTSYQLKKAE